MAPHSARHPRVRNSRRASLTIGTVHTTGQLAVLLGFFLVSVVIAGAMQVPVQPTAVPDLGPPIATPEILVPEVVVGAPEPRFVAPTRRDRIGRVWAPVLINGKGPFRLVLDTGASSSAVIAQVAASLGISVDASPPIRVKGITGTAIVPAIAVDGLQVGDLSIETTVLPVVPDVFGGAEGVLGIQGLSNRRILIDFGRDRIEIARSHGERAQRGFTTLPLKLTRSGLLTLKVQIGGTETTAIIDTGAQQSIGNIRLRDALVRRAKATLAAQDIVGVTLDVQRGNSAPVPPIGLGDITVDGAHVTFGDMFIFELWNLTREPALVIGMDVLGLFDTLIIDYKLRELQVRLHRE